VYIEIHNFCKKKLKIYAVYLFVEGTQGDSCQHGKIPSTVQLRITTSRPRRLSLSYRWTSSCDAVTKLARQSEKKWQWKPNVLQEHSFVSHVRKPLPSWQ